MTFPPETSEGLIERATDAGVEVTFAAPPDRERFRNALALTLHLRAGAAAAAVAVDLMSVYRALNDYDRRLRGSGLTPGEARDEQTADGPVIRLVLTPAD